jgi:hypothetical protein
VSQLNLQVNEAKVYWDDEGHGLKKCHGCGSNTNGRATLDSPTRSFANFPYCMNCAMTHTLNGQIAAAGSLTNR